MGQSNISYTYYTHNIVEGCQHFSSGCLHCYAEEQSNRFGNDFWGPDRPRKIKSEAYWKEPLKWNKAAEKDGVARRVLCGSLCDVFEDNPTVEEEREKLWPLIDFTPWLDWLLLTKRAERIAECLPNIGPGRWMPNVWIGVSIESNDYAWRADYLRNLPIAVPIRFVSYEPALGPLDQLDLECIDLVIYGGESGSNFRPDNIQWARDMLTKCEAEETVFYYKQAADLYPEKKMKLDGRILHEIPEPAVDMVRDYQQKQLELVM